MKSPAFLTGFAAEARIARRTGWPVEIGGGTTAGALRAARRLIEDGADAIVSFGLAGGLDPALPAGTLIVAEGVVSLGQIWRTNPILNTRLGGTTGHLLLGIDRIAASAAEKLLLGHESGAAAADMESAAVVAVAEAAGLPFAVLRAICDPADQNLPPAAMEGLDSEGRIAAWPLARSILGSPKQIGALIGLARDAAAARRALLDRVRRIGPQGGGMDGDCETGN